MPFQRHSEAITCWWSRLSFPHIWEPQPVKSEGRAISEPRYSTVVILADEMVPLIQQLEARLIAQSWPEWANGQPPPGINLVRAIKPGAIIRPGDPNLEGKWCLSANAKQDSPPWVVMEDAQGTLVPITDRSKVYAGCEAHVSLGLYTTQIKAAEPQINVGLNGIKLTGRAFPSFENRVTAEQAMKGGPSMAAPPPPPGGPDTAAPPMPGQPPAGYGQLGQPAGAQQGYPPAQGAPQGYPNNTAAPWQDPNAGGNDPLA